VTVELRPHAGNGLAAVVLSRSTSVQPADLPLEVVRYDMTPLVPLTKALDVLEDRLESESYASPAPVSNGTGSIGHRKSHVLQLGRGCSRIDVVLGKPARGVEAWLYDESRNLISHADGSSGATLFGCGDAGAARVDIEALVRGGPYALSLRTARRASDALLQHPLAASRLLVRLIASGMASSPEVIGDPVVLSLSAERLVTEDVLVPVGRCVALAVALGSGAQGIELRLVDSRTEEELDLVVGTHSASARACASGPTPSLSLRAEMRTATGAAPAVFSRRLLQGPR
jgi:hypothetical protein